jgi:hypothetical protein
MFLKIDLPKTTLFVTEIITRMMHNLANLLQKRTVNSLITGGDRFIRQNVFYHIHRKTSLLIYYQKGEGRIIGF